LELVDRLNPDDQERVKNETESIKDMCRESLGDIRRIMFDLRPTLVHDKGLAHTLATFFNDYEAKYNANDTGYIFVEDLPKEVYTKVQELSVKLAVGMKLRDFCRVDWRLDKNLNPYLLEVNAIPGFTDHSILPKAAGKAGLTMVDLCQMIVQMAMARGKANSTIKPLQHNDSGRLHGEKEKIKRVAH
jgi:hypothetical protein